jgi:hypothetical protein
MDATRLRAVALDRAQELVAQQGVEADEEIPEGAPLIESRPHRDHTGTAASGLYGRSDAHN